MIADGETVVAGVPSERLAVLAAPQLRIRHRRDNALGKDHSALLDGMSSVLRPNLPFGKDKSSSVTPRLETPKGFAGKSTFKINNSINNHNSKKPSPEANKSRQVTDLFSNTGKACAIEHRGPRSLKQYFSPEQLSEAFCTKFHVTDPLTGRTEIMTARRPGRASAEVNVADFNAYLLPRERPYSMKKAEDSIDHNILGLMPKPNREAKIVSCTTGKRACAPKLECREDWMTPTATAKVYKPLGVTKRKNAFPWTTDHTDNISHIYGGKNQAPPHLTRSCIRPIIFGP